MAATFPRKGLFLASVVSVLALATLAGCMGTGDDSSIYVKDAATDGLREVHVTFTKAQVQSASGSWDTVFDGKETIDLLALSDAGARERLASFDIPEGDYLGLRIFVSEVRVVSLDGTESHLSVFGNIVQIAESFTVGPDGIDILIDFDLDEGLDLEAGTYTPVVRDVQTSDDDSDQDGEDDVEDRDDDQDGREDDEDDDSDGDNEDDGPEQSHFEDLDTLCAAESEKERAEAAEERDEDLAEARAERDAVLADPDSTPEERSAANASFEQESAEIEADYQEELSDADDDGRECLEEDGESQDDEEEDRGEGEDDQDGREDDEDDDSDGEDDEPDS